MAQSVIFVLCHPESRGVAPGGRKTAQPPHSPKLGAGAHCRALCAPAPSFGKSRSWAALRRSGHFLWHRRRFGPVGGLFQPLPVKRGPSTAPNPLPPLPECADGTRRRRRPALAIPPKQSAFKQRLSLPPQLTSRRAQLNPLAMRRDWGEALARCPPLGTIPICFDLDRSLLIPQRGFYRFNPSELGWARAWEPSDKLPTCRR
jgi:hypothetical protein